MNEKIKLFKCDYPLRIQIFPLHFLANKKALFLELLITDGAGDGNYKRMCVSLKFVFF